MPTWDQLQTSDYAPSSFDCFTTPGKLFDSGFHCNRAGTVPLAMLAVFLEAKIALTLVQPEALANNVIRSNR